MDYATKDEWLAALEILTAQKKSDDERRRAIVSLYKDSWSRGAALRVLEAEFRRRPDLDEHWLCYKEPNQ